MDYSKNCLALIRALFFILIATVFSSSWAAVQPAQPASYETLSGWFGTMWVDDFKYPENSTVRHFLSDGTGEEIELDISNDMLRQHGGIPGLNGRQMRVTVEVPVTSPPSLKIAPPVSPKRKVLSIELEPASSSDLGTLLTATSGTTLAAQTGSKPYATLICKFSDTGRDPVKMSYFTGLMGATYPGMDHYWREVSYNQMNLAGSAVYGWYTLPHTEQEYLSGGFSRTFDCLAAADPNVYFPDFYGINFIFSSTVPMDAAGMGGITAYTLDGITKAYGETYIYGSNAWNQKIVAHEIGHSLGLDHTGGPYLDPYGSTWDLMSSGGVYTFTHPTYGSLGDHPISYHKDLLGWILPNQEYTAAPNTRQTIYLERLALPTDGGTAYRMAVIPIDSARYYTVEARRFAGYDNGIPAEGVVLHKVNTNDLGRKARVVDPDNNGNPSDAAATWTVGETFQDALYNITVSIDSITGTGYWVTISTERLGPMIRTQAVRDIQETQVKLVGDVNPKGEPTEAWFEWGLTTAYGNNTPIQNMGSGTGELSFTQIITGLARNTTYHFRAVGRNTSGTTYGADMSFNTIGANIDLVITQASGPTNLELGTSGTVIMTAWNYGTDPAGPFTMAVYLTDNPQLTGWTRSIGSYSVSNGLAGGAGIMRDIPVGISSDVTPGTYYLVGMADSSFVVGETDETNNTRSEGTILIGKLDLTMSSVSGPVAGMAGGVVQISDTVHIQGLGWGKSQPFSVGLYLSSDATITTSDLLIGSRSVPSGLTPPVSNVGTTNVTIPSSTPAGTYYIGAIADNANNVSESNESNNALDGNTIQVTAGSPDLIVSSVTGPNSARRGNIISGNVMVQNSGTAATGGIFSVALFLSTDNVITSADTALGTMLFSALNAGASQSLPYSKTIPISMAKGTYYIGAIADSANVIMESNEANNAKAGNTISIR